MASLRRAGDHRFMSTPPTAATPQAPPANPPAAAPATRQRGTDATLWLLSVANFAVGMGAFVVIGVLSPVAADLRISSAEAGRLLTVYALVYAIASPLLIALTGALDRARLLTGGLVLFGVGAVLCALSSSLEGVLAARAVMALGGAVVTPVAASIGVALVSPQERGRALALVFVGLTLAQALGVPFGAWLGYAYGWRTAFGVVAVLCVATVLLCLWRLPRGVRVPVATLASLGAVFSSWRQSLAVAFTALFIGSVYVPYTYVAPFLESRYGLGRDGVTLVLVLFGLGAVLGNAVGGRLTDRIGPQRTLTGLAIAQIVCMPALTLLPLPLAAFVALLTVWSVCGWSFMVPQQARLAAMSPQQVPVLLALNAAAIYVGGSVGSAVGGLALGLGGFAVLGLVGGSIAALALLSLRVYRCPHGGKPAGGS